MWVFTNKGFVSAVEHRDRAHHLMIRAREKTHLYPLLPYGAEGVIETTGADYRFRTTIKKSSFAKFMADQIASIDYDNFKNSIEDDQYHDACAKVWGVMYIYQDEQKWA